MHDALSQFFSNLLPGFDVVKMAVFIRTIFNVVLGAAAAGFIDLCAQITAWATSPQLNQSLIINWRDIIRTSILAGIPWFVTFFNSVRKQWLPSNERLTSELAPSTNGGSND